jgi:hypothetical protein
MPGFGRNLWVGRRSKQTRKGKKMANEIKIAKQAIKQAIKSGEIAKEISGMHRAAMQSITCTCKNAEIASELAWHAAKDVFFG